MAQSILTPKQQTLLRLLSEQKGIQEHFYLSGGTALSEYYLHHRYSEDLDFFSFEEIDPMAIQVILKTVSSRANIQKIDFQQSFNRNLFFLHFLDEETIKTEFTFYPFTQVEQSRLIGNLKIDSLADIAVNKAFTIYQNPRLRDFIDLFFILKHENWNFLDIIQKARTKFDSPIDPLQLTQQLLQVSELQDYPNMILQVSAKELQDFWMIEAKKLKGEAIQ